MERDRPLLYPVFLDLAHKDVLLVGGGEVAFRRAPPLLLARCRLTVVATHFSPAFRDWLDQNRVTREERRYRDGEAEAFFLVIAATDDPAVNHEIFEDGTRAGRLVNVADDPRWCSFQVPAMLRRGDLQIAVSTGGICPALAARLRQDLDRTIPERYGPLLERLAVLREHLQRTLRDPVSRKRSLEAILTSGAVERFLEGDEEPLEEAVRRGCDGHDPDPG